jgi:hypothetical protein
LVSAGAGQEARAVTATTSATDASPSHPISAEVPFDMVLSNQ